MGIFWTNSNKDDDAKQSREAYEQWLRAQKDHPKIPKPPAPAMPWSDWDRTWAKKAEILLD